MLEWDKLPNETPPTIKHPLFVGEALYRDVYLPEMELYSLAPPLKQADNKAPGSWFRARTAALKLLSLEEFGLKEGATTAEPRLQFRLVARANHSNFPECTECRNNRKENDKLGSEWNFLPQPPNMRFGKETSSRCTCMCLTRIAHSICLHSRDLLDLVDIICMSCAAHNCFFNQSNGDARVVMRGSSHHSSGFSPYHASPSRPGGAAVGGRATRPGCDRGTQTCRRTAHGSDNGRYGRQGPDL